MAIIMAVDVYRMAPSHKMKLTASLRAEFVALTRLAWPLLLAQITQILMGVSDTIMAGRYSYTDMAAVAVGVSITLPLLFFLQGIALALSPLVARKHGLGETLGVAKMTQSSMILTLGLSLFLLLFCFFVPALFAQLDMEDDVRTVASQYVIFVLLSAPAFALFQSLRNCCEGVSLTRPSMVIAFIGLGINIPANYAFIYGIGPIPALGGVGCAIATMLVFYISALAIFAYVKYAKNMHKYAIFAQFHAPSFDAIRSQFKLGLPIAMTIVCEVTLFAIVALLLAPLGAEVVAAHQIALNFSSLMFMFPMSIGIAVAIRVGYFSGQQAQIDAKQSVFCGFCIVMMTATLTASISILLRHPIASVYTTDIGVINLAASLLYLAALFQFSDAIQVVSANALRGYKDTTVMFILSFISYWVLGLPIGIVLGLTDWLLPAMGAAGFWIVA